MLKSLSANFYEGGRYTLANNDFQNASNAPFEELATTDRDTMRARARWLFANNPIIANIDKSIINNTIGQGISVQPATSNEDFNKEVEDKWLEWCEKENCDITNRFNFNTMQRMILGQRMTDGEIGIQLVIRSKREFPLTLQFIEADYFDKTFIIGSDTVVEGVELDKYGMPIRYHFRDRVGKPFSIKAKNFINYFLPENRFTQYRGISEYKQTIIDLKNFAAFNEATIKSARARANIAYVIETENGLPKKMSSGDQQLEEINGVFVEYLKSGERLKVIDPTSSGTGYKDFVEHTIRLIAAARNVSYELAFRDFTNTNFSSARASLLQDQKVFKENQESIIDYVIKPIYRLFIKTTAMSSRFERLDATDFWKSPSKYYKANFIVPEVVYVDPLKEINAKAKEVELGVTTLTEIAKSKGKDFADIVRQRVEEQRLMKEAGIDNESE
ncbi:hypothetical protein NrS5_39 [Nitratiruptor phage NrS-5]|uniref:phage portal protein n=1 Tax=unclassified Nitratiruptor TaxID=2624044 RepID=UPI001916330D|nr:MULTISPECIES: phage portal protein [unclassified Nitratiruptor]BCD61743.1 hypothetical protein NitYY0813_C0603 [Nitratiruptor sp. YY08-13]BCD65678.1 hypothetical protein NitYY0826_C0605 [Nitratiruptor sp. YY08-26]BCD83221.1 hypothetical protein NrS4_39 [Nitratiruptor phage NrS-4]BCD83280.1 hypothetical protein NrS5_39 [Nitratiruptor phage NrS-5]